MDDEHCRKTSNRHSSDAFIRCAALVLPYFNPTELASISSTCQAFHQISEHITFRRSTDAASGFENLPIPFLNPISGDTQPYSYFLYTPTQTLPVRQDFRQPWGSDNNSRLRSEETRPDPFLFRVDGANGCECASCVDDCCPCLEAGEFLLTRECGPSCNCDSGCRNRATQQGVTAGLKIVKDERKGWGLYATELIPRGQFVCEYAGELLSTKEARKRQQTYDDKAGCLAPALLVVKEHLPSGNTCMRINIDATTMGNIARFINHSFSYGDVRLRPNGNPCFCGAASCAGILPSEPT